ncbi:Cbp1 family collagen-binding glycoprotein adhesin [Prevotella sp.]|uniref:Cbp1 family collagen-binding glycoprotein adhesin n=1 Tax=Prevotella sp. TaxID=59823 RepID=UPI0030784768
MTKLKFILVLWAFVSILACKNERVDMAGYMKERDSLIIENQANKEELAELNSIISTVSAGLDSIAIQEGILYSGKTRDGVALNRNQIIANINSMAEILKRQREKIQSLQDSLAMRSANPNKSSQSIEKLQNVIAFLNKQLAEKDNEIQSLRRDVNSKNKDINQLRTSLSDMRNRAEKAENRTQVVTQALAKQDEIINECYIKIGTKKQLVASGLLKGGFLQKKKVNYEDVDKSKFNAVDIRKFREVTLKSNNPKILTPQPSNNSFHFEENGDGTCTLVITNPTQFWSVSNFLIIQL